MRCRVGRIRLSSAAERADPACRIWIWSWKCRLRRDTHSWSGTGKPATKPFTNININMSHGAVVLRWDPVNCLQIAPSPSRIRPAP